MTAIQTALEKNITAKEQMLESTQADLKEQRRELAQTQETFLSTQVMITHMHTQVHEMHAHTLTHPPARMPALMRAYSGIHAHAHASTHVCKQELIHPHKKALMHERERTCMHALLHAGVCEHALAHMCTFAC